MRLWELEEGDEGQGNAQFVGARGWEAALLDAEQIAWEQGQLRREPRQQQENRPADAVQQLPLPEINIVDDGLDAGMQNLAMDEAPEPQFHMPARRGPAQQRRQNRRPAMPEVPNPDQGLQRFLEMVQNDEEDGWDSDEMGDDEEFRIPDR